MSAVMVSVATSCDVTYHPGNHWLLRKQQCWLVTLLTASRSATACVTVRAVPFMLPCTERTV